MIRLKYIDPTHNTCSSALTLDLHPTLFLFEFGIKPLSRTPNLDHARSYEGSREVQCLIATDSPRVAPL